ncbi:hypothetical protein Q4E93_19410 [Flavitalea sp. BT771]|uniref:hypothetical protein n=1 Tax=Flavitalea sp. BT771 TaxID=3063329 RepID=UPI0026E1B292|nr:hypothetical protein [Flavitalea sp. BT771]MDO6432784.1 hypothetical protein [Flavitalea sp. BT771]MDV6221940.1 hypothetical protein [Flavitalea sp. BT771]
MNHRHLIAASRAHLAKYPAPAPVSGPMTMFPGGARWMYDRLNELDGGAIRPFDPEINYTLMGYLKYGICLTGASLACWWSLQYDPFLLPLSILVFYLLEVQFLFLFPLLIDGAKQPILSGIREVLRIGVIRCLLTVIPLSIFMMTGLLRRKNNFHHWYIGCLSILIWYKHEVRNRISPSL